MKILTEVSARPIHRKPWWPTSLGFATALVALLAWRLLAPPPHAPEPEVSAPHALSAAWPRDEAITESLQSFLAGERATTAPPARTPEFKRGVALGLYSQTLEYDYGHLIDEIGDHGANWVSLFFNMYQDNKTSTEMNPLTRLEDQEALLVRAARQAHSRGMKVLAFPLVLLTNAGPREWRGNIAPADLDAWFRNYGDHIVRLARASEAAGIEAICVGSEFSSLEQHADHWRKLIAEVREVFSGEIIYSANWDHYAKVGYWDAVDQIGLSGYYELTKSKDPTLEELTDAWKSIQADILNWREAAAPDKPILFTEVGYANLDGTNVYPWNYTMKGEPDPREQALCYEAFIRTWAGRPEFGGAYFYNWFGFDSLDDTGYSPRGKPAAHLIRVWFDAIAEEEARLSAH